MQKNLIQLSSLIFFFIVWFLISSLIIYIPNPVETIKTFFLLLFFKEPVMNTNLIEHATASIVRVITGSVIAFGIAIPLGVIMGWFKRLEVFFEVIIELLRPIPPIAWIPISIILFGKTGQIFIVFVGAFFPALINTVHGVTHINKSMIELAKTFGAKQKQIITKIVIPASLPSILTGIRIGLGVAWMSIVAAEMMSLSARGLGYFILVMHEVGHTAEMISAMIMIGLIGYLMNKLLLILNNKIKHPD